MKKSLIALAAVAAVSAASAQSTVTISGTFGAGMQSYDTTVKSADAAAGAYINSAGALATGKIPTGTKGATALAAPVTAGTTKSKGLVSTDASVKFTAVEDLGGGLKASAAVQFAANELRAGALTKEDSSVGLSGGFGSLAFANTRSGNSAIGAHVFASWMPKNFYNGAVEATRLNIDTLSYVSPALIPGLTVGYALIEATQGQADSAAKVNVFSASYSNGPLSVSATYKDYNKAAEATPSNDRTEGAVTYDLGMAKVGLGFGTKRTDTDKALTTAGVSIPLGALTLGANYATRGTVGKFYEAGAVYALSKRTSAQLMMGSITGGSYDGKQYRVGVLHNF